MEPTNEQNKSSPLEQSKTPAKVAQKVPESLETALSQKMKNICFKIYQKSTERLRKSREEYNQRQEHNDKIRRIVNSFNYLGCYRAVPEDLTMEQREELIESDDAEIQRVVAVSTAMKKAIKQAAESLQEKKKQRQQAQKRLENLKQCNKKSSLMLGYAKYLKGHLSESQQAKNNIAIQINSRAQQIATVKQQTSRLIDQCNFTESSIRAKQQQHSDLLLQLTHYSKRRTQLSHQKIPNQMQMINCMFLVGMLSEQNFVLNVSKGMKGIQKGHKVYSQLSRRQITIDCQNSQIIELKILTAIYMHCKSLLLSNIVTLMKTLSFFSDQLRSIYHFKAFQRYIVALLEKDKLNQDWVKIKQSIELSSKDLTFTKKKLIICVKKECLIFIKSVLEVLQTNNRYEILVGTLKAIIELKQMPEQNEGNQMQTNAEYNQLLLHLNNYKPLI